MFFQQKAGPRKTILIQTPIQIIIWIALAFVSTKTWYNVCRFFTAFLATAYYQCGEELMIKCVHRRYLKIMYTCCQTAFFLGVLTMNAIGSVLEKRYLCLTMIIMLVLPFIMLLFVPESPLYLMNSNPEKARNALRWYRGNTEIRGEFETMEHYLNFQKYETSGFTVMLKCKVVLKAIIICAILFALKVLSGFYAVVLFSSRWFGDKFCCITPYVDNIIFSLVIAVLTFCSIPVHLYGKYGVRKPLLASTFLVSVLLIIFGYYKFILGKILSTDRENCVTLPTLCVYVCAYTCGLNICPELVLYNYLPFQIYDFVNKLMNTLVWLFIYALAHVYAYTIVRYHSYFTLWVLACLMFAGYIFVMLFVIDVKNKSLVKIQTELGGNPVGTRGSRRQRIATPMDPPQTDITIKRLITRYTERLGDPQNPKPTTSKSPQ